MKNFCFTIALLLLVSQGFSQSVNINLSSNHQRKLSTLKSGHSRMKKFYTYFKRDSIKHFKELNRQQKRNWDSVARAGRKQARLNRNLSKNIPQNVNHTQDSLNHIINSLTSIINDSTASDSIKSSAKAYVKDILIAKLKNDPNFTALEEHHNVLDSATWDDISKQFSGIDSLRSFFYNPSDLFEYSERYAETRLARMSEFRTLSNASNYFDQVKNIQKIYNVSNYKDELKDSVLEVGKDKAVEKALDYFAKNPTKLEAAGQMASKLFSRYNAFANSNDLSNARKNTSMEGKTLFERLVIGGTFNVLSTQPISIDLSPQVGYKFTSRFFVGAGMNYRATFGDSINYSWYVSPSNTSVRAFMNYDIVKSWYAYLEGEVSGGSRQTIEQNEKNKWNYNYFIGAGRRFLIHPKMNMIVTALYNLNNQKQNPVHPQRFQVRVGFQLSDLALRKKQINYDPNR